MGKGFYCDPKNWAIYDEHPLFLSSTAALNAWDRIQELGKRIESYIRVKKCQQELFSDFLQRLTKAIQIGVRDP